MIATVLDNMAETDTARQAAWRQLIDIIAQAGGALSDAGRGRAAAALARFGPAIPAKMRHSVAASIAARVRTPDLVALFGGDLPGIAAPVLSAARLADDEWAALIPGLPPASRSLLRHRRDLGPQASAALAGYGASDFALPPAPPPDPGTQIRELVARIEAFRAEQANAPPPATAIAAPAETFAFETAPDGAIDWVEGAPRGPLIGLSIAETGQDQGVDGQAAGAFRRRAPFRDARLLVGGAGSVMGDWRITAAPVFNPRDGRFAGYHGTARRPRPEEIAGAPTAAAPADSLRQLIHELRAPLNAILGFAEMIDRQVLGPAARAYRERAETIGREAQRLVELVDDLDAAVRAAAPPTAGDMTAAGLLGGLTTQFAPTLALRGARLEIAGEGLDRPVGAPLPRMLTRLTGAALGLAGADETIRVSGSADADMMRFSVGRPAALHEVEEAALLDPAYEIAAEDGTILGLGFTLRLIARLAERAGGRLSIGADALVVTVPVAAARETGTGV